MSRHLLFRRARLALSIFVLGLAISPLSAQSPPPLGAVIQKSGTTITGVTFRVWAPNATGVAVRGDFNTWGETALTKEAGSSGYWSGTVAAARPGQAYKYFLRWTGNTVGVWKNDPRAMWVRGGNSVIHDHAAFDWGVHVRPVVPQDRQIMYELHVGTFRDPDPTDSRPGTFDDVIGGLDYLERLGVNVLALMPVNEFGGDFSWGYNPEHLFAIETAYGGPDGLKRLVKAAHARGMQVQIDVVHNHWNPPPDGVAEFDGPADVYVFSDPVKAWTPWGKRPDYDKPEVRRFIEDQIRLYLDEYRVDGFRWDSPQNILGYDSTRTSANPDTVLASGKQLLTSINRLIHDSYPNRWSIAEDANLLSHGVTYPDNAFWQALTVADIRDSFDGHWQTSFHNEITPEVASATPNVGRILAKVNGWSEPPGFRVIFTDNHDKAGNLNNAVRLPDRLVPEDPMGVAARRKSLLSAALTLTAPGTPMLFMGQELHETGTWSDTSPLGWSAAAADGRRHRMLRAHRDLITLRNTLPALRNSNLQQVSGGINEDLDLMLYWRTTNGSPNSDDVVVLMNFSDQTRSNVNVSFPSNGTWRVRFNSDWPGYGSDFAGMGPVGNTVAVGGNRQAPVSIAAHSAIVLAKSAGAPAMVDDADGDGMADGWELLVGTTDPDGDTDGDGLSNLLEYERGYDPFAADPVLVSGSFNAWSESVGTMRPASSGSPDLFERVFFTPAAWQGEFKFIIADQWYGASATAGIASPSGGNLAGSFPAGSYVRFALNARTLAYTLESFTPATRVDTDADGMDDRWERYHGVTAASANPDADGFTNLLEFQRGSDPNFANRSTITLAGGFNDWNLSANPLGFVGDSLWRIDLPFRTGTTIDFKFTTGSWTPAWGAGAAAGVVSADPAAPNISRTLSVQGVHRFEFDERTLAYRVVSDATDADADGMQDAWETYYGVSDPAADPDADGWSNLSEYVRMTHPAVTDPPKRMTVTGDKPPLPIWNPGADNMVWSDARARWEWTGTFVGTPGSMIEVQFKFARGSWDTNWGGETAGVAAPSPISGVAVLGGQNLKVSVAANVAQLFTFNDLTRFYTVSPTTLSNNANLSALTLGSGTLSPAFSSTTTSYSASVPNTTTDITVTPTRDQPNATIEVRVNGGAYAVVTSGTQSGVLNLNVGANPVEIRVTAQDGTTIKTYTVSVTRAPSSNANLAALILSSGTLSPAFSSSVTSYSAVVANATAGIRVTPTREQADAILRVRVNGGAYSTVTSGTQSGVLNLNPGGNTVDVLVTAQDGTTTKTYTIEVTRRTVADEWRITHGLSSTTPWTTDSDGDGAPDLAEYALGGNPKLASDGRGLQKLTLETTANGDRLVLRWLRRTNAGGSPAVVAQSTADPAADWSDLPSAASASQTGVPFGFERREASIPADGARGFLRLRVTGP